MCGSSQTDRRDDTGSRDGLGSAKRNLGKVESHTNHPAGLSTPPLSSVTEGFLLTFGFLRRSLLLMMLSFIASESIINFFVIVSTAGQDDGGFALFSSPSYLLLITLVARKSYKYNCCAKKVITGETYKAESK